ncbi:MAG: imidazoleglycerol-phosphate dehydratase [Armatimonadetes bacterium]|nr:imidazoleglycerol-phosphate dehydratase [Armatimonadota bacterium]
MTKETPGVRYAEVERETGHTRVRVVIDLDGERKSTVDTGIGYFDLMLGRFTAAASFDLGVSAEGDLAVDDRHTVEDVGVCLGQAIRQALGDSEGIRGHGSEAVPMDDALCLVAVDVGGRPYLSYQVEFDCERLGGLTTECIEEFLRALVNEAGITLHVVKLAGHNNHHVCEALFMGLGRALRSAVVKTEQS